MQAIKFSFLEHVKVLRHAVLSAGAELILAGDSLHALVRKGEHHWAMRPQFIGMIDGKIRYFAQIHANTDRFAGWLPYDIKRWHLANDKLSFKRFAESAGLPVPRHYLEASSAVNDVIIKRPASSFGEHVRGPFRTAMEQVIDVAQGEYYESFVEGDLLKVWYWNERPLCAEREPMPFIVGDGSSTAAELIEARSIARKVLTAADRETLLARCDLVLRYYGKSLSTVLPRRFAQVVEFRYGTHLLLPGQVKVIPLSGPPEQEWVRVLHRAGTELLKALPDSGRDGALYTVDAVLDRNEQVWLLEMNSNPTVHPLAYPLMIETMLQTPPVTAGAAPATPTA